MYYRVTMSESKKRSNSNDENEHSSAGNSGSDTDNVVGGTSSDSCSDSESEFDEIDVDKRKRGCIRKILELERQFNELKESLFAERNQNLEHQLQQVRDETAAEYGKRLSALIESWRTNDETADVLKEFQLNELKILHDSEKSAAFQDYENKKELLYSRLKEDVESKMAKLKSDKRNADVNFEFWQRETRKPLRSSTASEFSNKRSGSPVTGSSAASAEKRRKPVTVSGPYIVYMLRQKDILEDWNLIQRAIMQVDIREKNV